MSKDVIFGLRIELRLRLELVKSWLQRKQRELGEVPKVPEAP